MLDFNYDVLFFSFLLRQLHVVNVHEVQRNLINLVSSHHCNTCRTVIFGGNYEVLWCLQKVALDTRHEVIGLPVHSLIINSLPLSVVRFSTQNVYFIAQIFLLCTGGG